MAAIQPEYRFVKHQPRGHAARYPKSAKDWQNAEPPQHKPHHCLAGDKLLHTPATKSNQYDFVKTRFLDQLKFCRQTGDLRSWQ